MRVHAGLIWANAALQTYAASHEASVYVFDKKIEPSNVQPPSVSPNTARLLLAQRLGLTQYHSLQEADDLAIEHLNALRGTQKPVFLDEGRDETPLKLLVIVEGWEDTKGILDPNTARPAFTIPHPPPPSQNLQLAFDLLSQDRHRRSHETHRCSFELPDEGFFRGGTNGPEEGYNYCGFGSYMTNRRQSDAIGELQYLADSPSKSFECYDNGRTTILHISSLLDLLERIAMDPLEEDRQAYPKATAILIDAFRKIRLLPNSPELTVVLMPPPSTKSKQTDYGFYEVLNKHLHARQLQSEEPLSAPKPSSTSTPSSHPTHSHPLATSPPVKGPLPVCHPTLKAAQLATNNCSSHGTIYKKYSPPNEKDVECYACKCNKTVITNLDGTKKTIYWGGPACQKKDVSVPFFLLAGLTIAMLATVSWGVGLLFSIGQEELPSVIGAGVAGPRVHK